MSSAASNQAAPPAAHAPPPLPTFAGYNPAGAFHFLSVNARGKLQTDCTSAESCKTAYYALCWLSTRGETGLRGQITAATVAA